MFTVKWIVKTGAGETIRMFSADDVTVAYRDQSTEMAAPWMVAGREVEGALVILDPHDIGARSLNHGLVYVMNEAGATVGKYELGDHRLGQDQAGVTPPAAPSRLAA